MNTTTSFQTSRVTAAYGVGLLIAMGLAACGGGNSNNNSNNNSTPTPTSVTRLAADVALLDTLSGGFAEGISADPDTGDLYVGTDNSGPDSDLTGFILKAGSKESSFSNWALANTPDTQGLLVTGTRVRAGLLFVCVNPSNQVWALKLTDKSVVAKMALPVSAFCNDLGFDTSGQLFVTTNGNAGKPDILYKLAANLVPTTSASSTVASTAWKTWHTAPVGEGGLNGLVFSSTLGKLLWSQGASIRSSATTGDTATASTEVNLPSTWNVDGMQLTAAGNLLVIAGESSPTKTTNLGAQKINLSTGTKGATSAVAGGANCSTTVAIVGDDAFCTTGNDSNNQAIQKVLRLTGAGKL